ncbi:hypothetical protein [Ralstonia pseudosolanacearum]|uniref:hypothetical protein n=1 Tax=Ralstonia pseudosolanacearum TaxID=1310165 RepID=UPI003CF6B60E
MTAPEVPIDLDIAFRKLRELAQADGDLGYEYWNQIIKLLKRAARMQSDIDSLSRELEKCRAKLRIGPAAKAPSM